MPEAVNCILNVVAMVWVLVGYMYLHGCTTLQAETLIYLVIWYGLLACCVIITKVVLGYTCDLLPEAILYLLRTYLTVSTVTLL